MGPVANTVKHMGNGASRGVSLTIKNGPLSQLSKRCASNLSVGSKTMPLVSECRNMVDGLANGDLSKAALNAGVLGMMVTPAGGSVKLGTAGRTGIMQSAAFSTGSIWAKVDMAPADPILGLNDQFKADTRPEKALLGMGAYRDDAGKPYILDCVKTAEERIVANNMDHEYSGIDGIPSYREKCVKLGWGEDCAAVQEGRVVSCQSISGTGSLRVGLDFMREWYPYKNAKVYVPDPSWPTHKGIAVKAGFEAVNYRYYDRKNKCFDLEGMLADIEAADDHSIFIFHACAHNPTGCDPTQEQWAKILEVCKRKNHFNAFDSAYQGFASGDLERDAYSLRLFAKETNNCCLFQSFAKNFGLYGERAGCVSFLTNTVEEAKNMQSRIKQIARPMYSNPPIHGARIVDIVLGDKELEQSWHNELTKMSGRMKEMRASLRNNLSELGSKLDWSHVTSQIGMFAYTGLNEDQVNRLRTEHAIYMTMDGRISIAGLNTGNVKRIAAAFHEVTK